MGSPSGLARDRVASKRSENPLLVLLTVPQASWPFSALAAGFLSVSAPLAVRGPVVIQGVEGTWHKESGQFRPRGSCSPALPAIADRVWRFSGFRACARKLIFEPLTLLFCWSYRRKP